MMCRTASTAVQSTGSAAQRLYGCAGGVSGNAAVGLGSAAASVVSLTLDVREIPLLPDVLGLVEGGFVPGGTGRNLEFVRAHVEADDPVPAWWRDVLNDPQTSGGLAICISPDRADSLCDALRSEGCIAAVIGEAGGANAARAGFIRLR